MASLADKIKRRMDPINQSYISQVEELGRELNTDVAEIIAQGKASITVERSIGVRRRKLSAWHGFLHAHGRRFNGSENNESKELIYTLH